MSGWPYLSEEEADALPPVGTCVVSDRVTYPTTGHVLEPGTYDVHHMSPWGPVVYEKNDLGHRLVVERRHVAELVMA